MLQDDGILKETYDYGLNGFPAFTIDTRTGEHRGVFETSKLDIIQRGDNKNSFMAIKPESYLTYGFQLRIQGWADSPKKPFIKSAIFPLGEVNTGYCKKF